MATLRNLALGVGFLLCAVYVLVNVSSNSGTDREDTATHRHSKPSEQRMEASAKVCDALRELRTLTPDAVVGQSPFEFLGLNAGVAPFTPVLSSSSRGPQVQSQVEKIVTDAAVSVRENLWPRLLAERNSDGPIQATGGIRQQVLATYVVTAMLVDEHARLMYLTKVHPKLRKWDEGIKAIDALCGTSMRERGSFNFVA